LKTPHGVIITTNVVWWVVMVRMDIPTNKVVYYTVSAVIFVLDIIVASVLRDQLIHFFSQFVLPIQNPNQRKELAARVANFESGKRGPALFVKNGRVIKHEGETDKEGAGLIVLDTASALVLRTDTEIKDTVGPGIVFTKSYKQNDEYHSEYIAGSVDLRAQWQFIGPLTTAYPFLKSASTSKQDSDAESRRQQTSGLTRDGFEISPTISIKFRIKRSTEMVPTESGVTSYYGFDAEAVRNAITREIIQLGTSKNTKVRMEWNKLPAHLVVNIWREYIRKFKFNDLFASSGVSGLQTIEEMINKRVKKPNVEGLDDTGVPTREWVESLEFKQLQSRGLEIMDVRIHNVLFDATLEEQIIKNWSAEWLNIAQKEEKHLKEMEALIGAAARNEASKRFAKIASEKFGGKTTLPQENPFKTLQLLIQPLKEFILNESVAGTDMEVELKKLDEIWKWLLDNNPAPPADAGNRGRP